MEDKTMKNISIDNGHSYCTISEALEDFDINTIAHYMDDATRERVCNEGNFETDEEFIKRYLEIADDDIVIG